MGNTDEEVKEEKQPASLLRMLTRLTIKGFTSRTAPPKPRTSKSQKPTLSRSKSSASTSAELDRSTISKRLIRRRVETQGARNRPDYKENNSSKEIDWDQEPPPIL